MHKTLWLHYQHASVRDLAWLLLSPSLFTGKLGEFDTWHLDLEPDILTQWLTKLDASLVKSPTLFPEIDRSQFRRLGLYCEALLNFYLHHAPHDHTPTNDQRYSTIVKAFRVQNAERTIGECDFLIAKAESHLTHIELAVKFFLLTEEDNSEWDAWVGPNAIDRLDLKLQRMITHQLPLSQRKDTEAAFVELKQETHSPGEIESLHFIKGVLFFPHDAKNPQLPNAANPDLRTGTWMRLSEFLRYAKGSQPQCILCEKMDWLTGPNNLEEAWKDVDTVISEMRELYDHQARHKQKALPGMQVWVKNPVNTAQLIMVVPDHWPETNSPSRSI